MDMKVPVYFNESDLACLIKTVLPERLHQEVQKAYSAVLERKKGSEALAKCSLALREAIAEQVSDRPLDLDELRGKHLAREMAVWAVTEPRLLLTESLSELSKDKPYTLFILPPKQHFDLSPLDPGFKGLGLSSHTSVREAENAAAAYRLPIVNFLQISN